MATGKSSARHCCVPGCLSDDRYGEKVNFHTIPKDEKLRKQWIINIRRDEGPFFKISRSTVVCSKHFKKDDYKWTPNLKTLKRGSVPTIFDWSSQKEPWRVLKRKLPSPVKAELHTQNIEAGDSSGAGENVGDVTDQPMETGPVPEEIDYKHEDLKKQITI